ncbi:MAG: GGDEF domain-containing protein, partial [Lachnospiraceae bacterium]|nr:GGDEF domain-containing protein [Lachnospiraceae bacterium]
MICLVFTASVGSLISSIGHNHVLMGIGDVIASEPVMYFGSFIYMMFHISIPVFYYIYVRTVMGIEITRLSDGLVTFAPLTIAYIFLAFTPINRAIFYYENGIYHRGEYMWIFYFVAVWYIVVTLNNIVMYRENIRISIITSFCSFALFALVGVLLQFINSNLKIENFANAVVLLVLYITIERPGDYVDSVTGLQNDYAFYVNAAIRIRRGREARIIIVSVDNAGFLDNSIGYESTTGLLIQAADYLNGLAKEKSATAFRMSRDMFALMINEGARVTQIELMQTIRKRFSAPFSTGKYSVMLFDCSLFISWPDDIKTAEELARIIDIFSDKVGHRMRHEVPVSIIDLNKDLRKKEIDALLRTAIEGEHFAFKYQPVKNAATGLFDSVEMKPMIESAEHGMITPNEYFDIAEDNGTAVPITMHIIEVCFEYMNDCGMTGREISEFAIPVPNAFLLMRSAAEWVIEKAVEYEIDPSFVTFELSERTLVNYTYALEENINALNVAGFSFMLLDYGNGYTDAEMMIEMHLKEVSLNRDLIASAPMSEKADTLVRCAVDMMRSLSIGIKVSGIDSQETEEYATQLGVD